MSHLKIILIYRNSHGAVFHRYLDRNEIHFSYYDIPDIKEDINLGENLTPDELEILVICKRDGKRKQKQKILKFRLKNELGLNWSEVIYELDIALGNVTRDLYLRRQRFISMIFSKIILNIK